MQYLLLIIVLVCFMVVTVGLALVIGLYLGSDELEQVATPRNHVWYLDMMNVETGRRYRKRFRYYLVMGRNGAFPPNENFIALGDEHTISRCQCEIAETAGGMVVQNLSRVNMTYHNGEALDVPRNFGSGDYLDIGGSRYYVYKLGYGE